jgi:hypothetical protein
MKRTFWTAAGMVAGAATTIWAQRQVHEQVKKLTPDQLASGALGSIRETRSRVRRAIAAGQHARSQREDELWQSIGSRSLGAVPPGMDRPDNSTERQQANRWN